MIIVLCIDDNYLEQACAVIRSIKEHHKNDIVKIFIIGLSLSDQCIEKVFELSTDKLSINHVNANAVEFDKFTVSGHISHASYAKIAIPRLLKSESKVLYLDSDLIVTRSLINLWDTDLNGVALAAVTNPFSNRNDAIFMNKNSGYFNAGVMLLNLDYIRKYELDFKAYSFLNDYMDRAIFHDQDALNHAVDGNWLELNIEFNFQTFFLRKFNRLTKSEKSNVLKVFQQPVIIHYSSGMKPWEKFDPHPLRKEFLKYYEGVIHRPNDFYELCRNFVRSLFVKNYYFWFLK